jgi:cytochrome c oxidase cbb3-type subunit IV
MLKDVISKIDFSLCDEVAVVLFAISFFAVIWGVFRLRSDSAERFSDIPINDHVVDPRKGPIA